ncbi:MAG TPA: hypothetical protein VFV66_02990 [Nonomuraea sp.]|nr:hypothetical protein [Nonomuraea sp.]
MPSNQTPPHTGAGKTRARTAFRSPTAAVAPAPDDDLKQDDVAVDDLLVQGVRMADLKPENLAQGSPAWNAAAAYRLIAYLPYAAAHFENLAREWAALANAQPPAASTGDNRERGREQ